MSPETRLLWQVDPQGLLGALALGGGALLVLLSLLSTAGRPPWVRGLATTLRAVAVAGVLMAVLWPRRQRLRITRGAGAVAVLVDRSDSMALPGDRSGESRLGQAQRWLGDAAPALRRWQGASRLAFFRVGRTAEGPLSKDTALRGSTDPAFRQATDLADALRQAESRLGPRQLRGVLLLSDGRDTRLTGPGDADADRGDAPGAQLRDQLHARLRDQLRAQLRPLGIPVHVVPLGGAAPRDAAIEWIQADDLAFARSPARIQVGLRVTPPTASARVRLWWGGRVVAEREVSGGAHRQVELTHTPTRVGPVPVAVELLPLPGEISLGNNLRWRIQRVVRDRIRVLQVAGRPSWDVRFVRQHFKRDPNVDLISFYILRTHRNATHALPSELSLIRFPADELFTTHLPSFDLVILQDFERYPAYVAPYLDNLAAWVRRGGGLALLGGEHTLTRGGFYGSALASVLPVRLLPPGPTSTLLDERAYRPRWTPLARRHPLTAPFFSGDLVRLGGQPALGGVNKVAGPAPDAAVLAVHPSLRTPEGAPAPVAAVREVDRGRSFALLTDTLWRWRFRGGPEGARAYDAFWRQVVRYLLREPGFERLRLTALPATSPGASPSTILLEASDRAGRPAPSVSITWQLARAPSPRAHRAPARAGPAAAAGALNPAASAPASVPSGAGVTDAEGRLQIALPPLAPGAYHLEARCQISGRQERGALWIATNDVSPEHVALAPAPGLLAALAEATGGRVVRRPQDLASASLAPRPLLRRQALGTEPVVGSPWLVLIWVCVALGLEWALRRRFALP